MARPKKAPRERLQITITKPNAKRLRAFAKRLDRDISEVVEAAVVHVMDRYKALPLGATVVEFPDSRPVIPLNPPR